MSVFLRAIFLLLPGLLIATTPATSEKTSSAPTGWTRSPAFVHSVQKRIHSAHTGRDYLIFLSIPETPPPAGGFPVLYLLDGENTFPLAALMSQKWREHGPRLGLYPGIIVGIGHIKTEQDKNPRAEDFTPPAPDLSATGDFSGAPQGGADRFLDFLDKELRPQLAAEFSLHPRQQTLFGHSYGGLFTLHTLFTRPDSFQRYIAASPSIWWNNTHIFKERDAFLRQWRKGNSPSPKILITVGDQEQKPLPHHQARGRAELVTSRKMVDQAKELAAELSSAGLPASFLLFPDENHGSALVTALNHAIRIAFSNPVSLPKEKLRTF